MEILFENYCYQVYWQCFFSISVSLVLALLFCWKVLLKCLPSSLWKSVWKAALALFVCFSWIMSAGSWTYRWPSPAKPDWSLPVRSSNLDSAMKNLRCNTHTVHLFILNTHKQTQTSLSIKNTHNLFMVIQFKKHFQSAPLSLLKDGNPTGVCLDPEVDTHLAAE